MSEASDARLLREYAEHGNEAAFREIVVRHTDAVYSAALCQVLSPNLARDVAQSVFTDLTTKAPSLSRTLRERASLLGWLYRSARFAALNQLRQGHRRQARERLAMQNFEPTPDPAPEGDSIRPVLDEAMSQLSDEDWEALLLRFLQSHDFRAIGQSLGVSDDAAQKGVGRALEKLRVRLTGRGVTTSAATLSLALSAHIIQAAPAGLAAALSKAALASSSLETAATLTAYIGFKNPDIAQMGIAHSKNGITNWERFKDNPIIRLGEPGWDSCSVYKPYAVPDPQNNRWLLFSNGREDRMEQIGVAIHNGLDLGF